MYNAHEEKLKRKLDKIGYSLYKRGRGDDYGYMIVNQYYNVVVAGSNYYGLSLEEVEEWLSDD